MILFATSSAALFTALMNGSKVCDFLLSMGTNLFSALIILLIVDQRLRDSDKDILVVIMQKTLHGLMKLAMPTVYFKLRYSERLKEKLTSIRPRDYVDRPFINKRLDEAIDGCHLIGSEFAGKTTAIQVMASRIAQTAIDNPYLSKIPVYVSLAEIEKPPKDLTDLVFKTICAYRPVNRRMVKKILDSGKLVLLADSLDESESSDCLMQQIRIFRELYPLVKIVLALDSTSELRVDNLSVIDLDTYD